ncbi:MAG TPA: tetratricopeptide repeat protein, partial [Flavisolibacter sp.]|nr:tetratricopeptide repeat protein [Flavisolibacter sp.]
AFAEKESDGYYKYIGSNLDGNKAGSIATTEKKSFTKDLMSPRPSRNDAFLWQVRSMIEMGKMIEAATLIATLKNDPFFPSRLNGTLDEVQSYWFYKKEMWDSSATHLIKALNVAGNNQEKARWEFLAAQMYEMTGKTEEAFNLYNKCLSLTTDPIMDIYARLNLVKLNKEGGENYIDKNIADLVKMAKRDKYEEYRDVIYYMAAQMEMDRNHWDAAREYLLKSAKYNNGNAASRNHAYLVIADLLFDQKKYIQASSFYDSIQSFKAEPVILSRINDRKAMLAKVTSNSFVIIRQDSLQRIAVMPEQERTVYISRLLKQIRKQQGIKDEAISGGSVPLNNSATPTLFQNDSKGDWYFYNATLKTDGATQFKQIWGNRPNVDNWRRFADVNQQLMTRAVNNTRPNEVLNPLDADNSPTFNSLLGNVPIGELKLQQSNDSIRTAYFNLGLVYMNELEDYSSAITAFEKLQDRFPGYTKMDEVLFDLYYCYNKLGKKQEAQNIKKTLLDKYPLSRFGTIANTGFDPTSKNIDLPQSTKEYETIYELFIEGKFDEAELEKKRADSIYKTNHWEPQLLYIEAVYNIRLRNDSVAKNILQTLIGQNPSTPLAKKAQNLVQVLSKRKQIEDELTKLQVERVSEDSVIMQPPVVEQKPRLVRNDSMLIKTKPPVLVKINPQMPGDTSAKNAIVKKKVPDIYYFDPAMKSYVMIVLDKVDAVFVNEAKNAFNRYNQEQFYNQQLTADIQDLDADHKLLLIGNFSNVQAAIDYLLPTRRTAPNEIVPWLKSDKYSFSIITEPNLEVLKNKKDLVQYKKFLDQNLAGKF